MSISILDTHVHIWDLEKVHYSWLQGDVSILARNYYPIDLFPSLHQVHVTEAILVQAANNKADTKYMLNAADNHDWIKGVVGWLPLQDPAKTQRMLETPLFKNSYLKGIRHLIHNEPSENWLLQDSVIESLKIISEQQLTYDIVGDKNGHIKAAIKLAEKIPNLKIVLDHLNNPPLDDQLGMENWRTHMKEAAQHQNIFAKISGLNTTNHIQPAIEYVLEQFGVNKCFMGGDWPVSLLKSSYIQTMQSYRMVIENVLNKEQQEKVFNKNAKLFYKA